jgi:hypothetical protein
MPWIDVRIELSQIDMRVGGRYASGNAGVKLRGRGGRPMKNFGPYIDEAIPHEAGHILVGRAVGFPVRGLDVEVEWLPDRSGISVGNFATLSYSPSDEQIRTIDPEHKAAYILLISGGIAGNTFAGLRTLCQGADADRKALARLTDVGLEEIAESALEIIGKRRRAFRQLVSLIRQRFTDRVWKNPNVQAGRLNLLTEEDLDRIFSEYASR